MQIEMVDILAAISETAVSMLLIAFLVFFSPSNVAMKRRLAIILGSWFVAIVGLAAVGVFGANRVSGVIAVGMAVLVPVIIALAVALLPGVRAIARGLPLALLVALNIGRLVGAFFLILFDDGRLPSTFAHSAAWGDITTAVLAIPVARMIYQRTSGWRVTTLVWSIFGLADLVVAVCLGVGSAPKFPLRFIFDAGNTDIIGLLPWVLIPGFLVPLYIILHLTVFYQLTVEFLRVRRMIQTV